MIIEYRPTPEELTIAELIRQVVQPELLNENRSFHVFYSNMFRTKHPDIRCFVQGKIMDKPPASDEKFGFKMALWNLTFNFFNEIISLHTRTSKSNTHSGFNYKKLSSFTFSVLNDDDCVEQLRREVQRHFQSHYR